MKLETYLRMANLPYKVVPIGDPRKGPKKKLPFIDDNGLVIADSGIIINYLKQKYTDTLDLNLTELQKAQGLALQRLIEEHLYWIMVYSRWVDPVNWPITKKSFFAKLPFLMRDFIAITVKKNIIKELYDQGIGRHNSVEIYQLGLEDLKALSTILNNQAFLLGDAPTIIDASGYAFLANILEPPITSPLQEYARSQKHFINYCAQMKERFYKDYRFGIS